MLQNICISNKMTSYNKRESNQVAHLLVEHAKNLEFPNYWIEDSLWFKVPISYEYSSSSQITIHANFFYCCFA